MRVERVYKWVPDLNCPHCGVPLAVDDPDDFEHCGKRWSREEDFDAVCPECAGEFAFRVVWEPTYPDGAWIEEAAL